MNPSLLLIGDFATSQVGNRSVAEDLASHLDDRGWRVITAARTRAPIAKLGEMLAIVWRARDEYAVASIDVFSGRAFLWADLTTRLLRRLGKPIVLVLRGGGLPELATRQKTAVAALLERSDRVIAPSEYLRRSFEPLRHNIQVIPNGLPVDLYGYRERRHIEPRIVWLRAFKTLYNPSLAPRVLAHLRHHVPEATLTMIGSDHGDGSLQRTQAATAEMGLANAVTFSGAIPKSEVPQVLAKHDLFLNTTNVDNTPVTVIEAMASGLPVVSTNAGGIPDLVVHEETALLTGTGDAEQMAAALLRLLREPDLSALLSRAGRRFAETVSWDRIVPMWSRLFLDVLEERDLSSPH